MLEYMFATSMSVYLEKITPLQKTLSLSTFKVSHIIIAIIIIIPSIIIILLFCSIVPITGVAIASDPTLTNPIIEGTPLSLTCTVKMDAVQLVDSDWQHFDLQIVLFRDDSEVVTKSFGNSTNLTYAHQIASFNLNDSGNYTCKAAARAHPSSVFINDSNTSSNVLKVTTGNFIVTQNS